MLLCARPRLRAERLASSLVIAGRSEPADAAATSREQRRSAAAYEAQRADANARRDSRLVFCGRSLPMPGDGHCLFHGLHCLTFVGTGPSVLHAMQMRAFIAGFMTSKIDGEAAEGTTDRDDSWSLFILLQRENNPSPTGQGGTFSEADFDFVRAYILEMKTGESTLLDSDLGLRVPGWGGHVEICAWAKMMRHGVFQQVPNATSRHYNGLEVFSPADLQHPITKKMWAPPMGEDRIAWFKITLREPDHPPLETNPQHILSFATIEYKAGTHFNILQLQGTSRNEIEWQAETINLIQLPRDRGAGKGGANLGAPAADTSTCAEWGINDYLPGRGALFNGVGEYRMNFDISLFDPAFTAHELWQYWGGLTLEELKHPGGGACAPSGGLSMIERCLRVIKRHPECLAVPETFTSPHWKDNPVRKRAPGFRPITYDQDGETILLDAKQADILYHRVRNRVGMDLSGVMSGARLWCQSCIDLWDAERRSEPPPRACCIALQPAEAHCWIHHEVAMHNCTGGWCYSCGEIIHLRRSDDARAQSEQRPYPSLFHVPLNHSNRGVCHHCNSKSNDSQLRGADPRRRVSSAEVPSYVAGGPPAVMASNPDRQLATDRQNGIFHRNTLVAKLGSCIELRRVAVKLREVGVFDHPVPQSLQQGTVGDLRTHILQRWPLTGLQCVDISNWNDINHRRTKHRRSPSPSPIKRNSRKKSRKKSYVIDDSDSAASLDDVEEELVGEESSEVQSVEQDGPVDDDAIEDDDFAFERTSRQNAERKARADAREAAQNHDEIVEPSPFRRPTRRPDQGRETDLDPIVSPSPARSLRHQPADPIESSPSPPYVQRASHGAAAAAATNAAAHVSRKVPAAAASRKVTAGNLRQAGGASAPPNQNVTGAKRSWRQSAMYPLPVKGGSVLQSTHKRTAAPPAAVQARLRRVPPADEMAAAIRAQRSSLRDRRKSQTETTVKALCECLNILESALVQSLEQLRKSRLVASVTWFRGRVVMIDL